MLRVFWFLFSGATSEGPCHCSICTDGFRSGRRVANKHEAAVPSHLESSSADQRWLCGKGMVDLAARYQCIPASWQISRMLEATGMIYDVTLENNIDSIVIVFIDGFASFFSLLCGMHTSSTSLIYLLVIIVIIWSVFDIAKSGDKPNPAYFSPLFFFFFLFPPSLTSY